MQPDAPPIAYAGRGGLVYQVFEPLPRRQIRKSYADNCTAASAA